MAKITVSLSPVDVRTYVENGVRVELEAEGIEVLSAELMKADASGADVDVSLRGRRLAPVSDIPPPFVEAEIQPAYELSVDDLRLFFDRLVQRAPEFGARVEFSWREFWLCFTEAGGHLVGDPEAEPVA